MSFHAWTDYPIRTLGDEPNKEAPIRPCEILDYDGDKYCLVRVEWNELEIKSGYLYKRPGRYGAQCVSRFKLNRKRGWKTIEGEP